MISRRPGTKVAFRGAIGQPPPLAPPAPPPPPPPPPPTLGADDFNRADGGLGSGWAAFTDGAMAITAGSAGGTGGGTAGAIRTQAGEAYGNNHFSRITVSSVVPGADHWSAAAVRVQASGQTGYFALYLHDAGANEYALQLWKRVAGTFTELDGAVAPLAQGAPHGYTLNGPLPAGSVVEIRAAGSQLSVVLNGVTVIQLADTSIPSGGAPGIAIFGGEASIDSWAGDTATAFVSRIQTISAATTGFTRNGAKATRVLTPDNPAVGVAHNFLYALPVAAEGDFSFGDPLGTLENLGIHNTYNLTIIEPNFPAGGDGLGVWYADAPGGVQYETFMVSDLVPWAQANYGSGGEKHWLVGFSRAGHGGFNLLTRHPTVFDRGAFWDFPFDLSWATFGASGATPGDYGTQANFEANYWLTSGNLAARAAAFTSRVRIWIGSYEAFQAAMVAADPALTAHAMLHVQDPATSRMHTWTSGWPANALAALAAM